MSFFQVPPKRNELLAAIINKVCPETHRTTLISLCGTRVVDRHEAFEVFQVISQPFQSNFQDMLNERFYLTSTDLGNGTMKRARRRTVL